MTGFSYTAAMMQHSHPPILDVAHAALDGTALAGVDKLSNYERLKAECQSDTDEKVVRWAARFTLRADQAGVQSVWLGLTVDTSLVQVCQRCLQPLEVALHVVRAFRFVESEAVAAQEDDDCEEDMLVISRTFDLAVLIEDEVLLELPLVPRHDVCPVPVKTTVADPEFDQVDGKPNPFAALAALKGK